MLVRQGHRGDKNNKAKGESHKVKSQNAFLFWILLLTQLGQGPLWRALICSFKGPKRVQEQTLIVYSVHSLPSFLPTSLQTDPILFRNLPPPPREAALQPAQGKLLVDAIRSSMSVLGAR